MAFAALIVVALTVAATPATAKVEAAVVDREAALAPSARIALANQLYVWREATGYRLIVIVRSARVPPAPPVADEYTVVMEVILDEAAVDLHIGRALASPLSPGASWRVVHVVMRPRLLSHDVDGAVLAGARAIITLVDPPGLRPSRWAETRPSPWLWAAAGVVALTIIVVGLRYPDLAMLLVLGGWYGVYRGQRPGSVLTRGERPRSRTRPPSHRSREARAGHR